MTKKLTKEQLDGIIKGANMENDLIYYTKNYCRIKLTQYIAVTALQGGYDIDTDESCNMIMDAIEEKLKECEE